MSPRRTAYRAPRPRREVAIAVAASGLLVVFTAVMVWVLGPHASSSGPSTPPLTAPASTASTAPSSPTSTPASSASTPSSTPGG